MRAHSRIGSYRACLLTVCLLLAACSQQSSTPSITPTARVTPTATITATPSPGTATPPHLDTTTCPFTLPLGSVPGRTVDCGFLTVPLHHRQPNGPTIRLAVARFHSTAAMPDPVPAIYLSGGPGGQNQRLVAVLTRAFSGVLAARDVVVFDQRGIGKSQPALDCPETLDQMLRDYAQPLTVAEGADHTVAAALRCRDRLVQQGIDLTAFTGAEDAADVNDLRLALGYDTVDLLGISYGTRLALTVLRDFPTIVHSAVLDSVLPLQENAFRERPLTFDRALTLLFDACTRDTRCAAAFPTLPADFTAVVQRLNVQPVTVTITDPTGASHELVITGDRFVGALFDWLYATRTIEDIPAVIAQLRDGKQTLLVPLLAGTLAKAYTTSAGMGESVVCSDMEPFERYDDVAAAAQGVRPELRATTLGLRTVFAICDQWPRGAVDPREHQAVASDVPILVLESADDPVTPPAFGQAAARTLTRSIYVETPGIGHSVVGNGGRCAQDLLQAFFAQPTQRPPTDCTVGLGVAFYTAG